MKDTMLVIVAAKAIIALRVRAMNMIYSKKWKSILYSALQLIHPSDYVITESLNERITTMGSKGLRIFV